jgi:MFS family permease
VKPALGLNNIGFVMAFFGATDALASFGIGKLSDKLGRTTVMGIGCGICVCWRQQRYSANLMVFSQRFVPGHRRRVSLPCQKWTQ